MREVNLCSAKDGEIYQLDSLFSQMLTVAKDGATTWKAKLVKDGARRTLTFELDGAAEAQEPAPEPEPEKKPGRTTSDQYRYGPDVSGTTEEINECEKER